jgi:hypothetical protein
MDIGREDGVALIAAMLAMMLMMALGAALVMTTSSETLVANNYRRSSEALYAAEAALERALDDLIKVADWDAVLNGSTQSAFVDGLPLSLARTLQDGSTIDLAEILNNANCQKARVCAPEDMDALSSERPWGANNPRWQLYAYGYLNSLLASTGTIGSPFYVAVMAGDDPAEDDADPGKDGASGSNPGSGVLALRAEAFGPGGAYKLIEATLERTDSEVRLLSWRERR